MLALPYHEVVERLCADKGVTMPSIPRGGVVTLRRIHTCTERRPVIQLPLAAAVSDSFAHRRCNSTRPRRRSRSEAKRWSPWWPLGSMRPLPAQQSAVLQCRRPHESASTPQLGHSRERA